MNRQTRFCKKIRFREDMLTQCQHSQQLRQHDVREPTTTLNMCQRSQRPRGHCVSVVNDYVDTVSA